MQLSVLLPAKDAAPTVDAAVESVLADLAPLTGPVELVLVDDGSRDGTGDTLRAWAARDGRVRVVPGPSRGIVGALQAGLEVCRGEYVARMDADDLVVPGRFAAQLEALRSDAGLSGVGGEVEIFADEGEVGPGMRHYQDWLNRHHAPEELYRERFVESPLCHPAVLLRRAALLDAGGYREGHFPEDYELWLRLFARGARLANLPRRVLRWRDHTRRLTRSHPRYALPAHLALKVEYLAQEPLARGPLTICGAGKTGLPLARALQEKGLKVVRFVEVHPRKVGTRLLGVPVVGYDDLGAPGEAHLLVAVGAKGAREQIREHLTGKGFREGEHFTCVA